MNVLDIVLAHQQECRMARILVGIVLTKANRRGPVKRVFELCTIHVYENTSHGRGRGQVWV